MDEASAAIDIVFCSTAGSPVGLIWVASVADGIVRVGLPGEARQDLLAWVRRAFPRARVVPGERENAAFHAELDEYFSGARRAFDSKIRLLVGAFGRRVLEETARIPYGTTATYKEIATAIGNPLAARAVGRALGSNPLPIVIPCHRVVGADGSLVGFGGGLALKEWLLSHERRAAGLRPGTCAHRR